MDEQAFSLPLSFWFASEPPKVSMMEKEVDILKRTLFSNVGNFSFVVAKLLHRRLRLVQATFVREQIVHNSKMEMFALLGNFWKY